MRSYTVAVASLAIGAPVKWTDNLLSQHAIPNIASEGRGVAQRISHSALIQIALVRQLHLELGLSVASAVNLSSVLLGPGDSSFRAGELKVSVDASALQRRLEARLADVLESVPTPRRGRPPVRT